MSLNSIKFEPTDIALLFKNSLVEIEEKKHAPPGPVTDAAITGDDPNATKWKYLGENKKRTLVIVHYPDDVHLPDKQLSFLTKLLAACGLNPGDVAIMNFHDHQPSQFNGIINYFKPKAVLLFNTKPADFGLPMNFPEFQVQAYKDTVFVSLPSLEITEPDKNLKGKLWSCLKKIYNL
jgi:hypothetical protein